MRRAWLVSLLFLAACPEGGPSFVGETGAPNAAILDSNLFFMPTSIDGEAAPHLLVDTGAPTVVVAPALVDRDPGYHEAETFSMLGLEYQSFPFIADDIISSNMGTYVAGGVIGCTAFCDFDVSFDYRAETVTLDGPGAPDDTIESHVIDIALEGGGLARDPATGTRYDVPRSRVIVDAVVEGRALRLLVDSGASVTVLRRALVQELLTDGRPTVEAVAMGMFGMDQSILFRLRTMSIAGAEVEEVIAAQSPGFEGLLDGISSETGTTIDGALGGTALREFFVTVAYDAEQLHLDRYPNRDHVRDEATRIGVLVTEVMTDYVEVGRVIAGTDAEAKNVRVGDRITAVDGEPIAGKTIAEVAELLAGTKGAVRDVTFACDGCAGFVGTKSIVVDYDVLALP